MGAVSSVLARILVMFAVACMGGVSAQADDPETRTLGVEEGTWIGYGEMGTRRIRRITCGGGKLVIQFRISQGQATSLFPKTSKGYFQAKLGPKGRIEFDYEKAGRVDLIGVTSAPVKFRGRLSGSAGGGEVALRGCRGPWEARRSLEEGKSGGSFFSVAEDWVLRFRSGGQVDRIDAEDGSVFSGFDLLGDFMALHWLVDEQPGTDVYYCPATRECLFVGRVAGLHGHFGPGRRSHIHGMALRMSEGKLQLVSRGSEVKELALGAGREPTAFEASQDFFFVRSGETQETGVTILYHLSAVYQLTKVGEVERAHGSFGKEAPKDFRRSAQLLRKAAEQGDADAQFRLGTMYRKGRGVGQDDAEAVKWYLKAAEQGQAKAQHSLAWMYRRGSGVPQDYSEAVTWFRRAAEQGYARAQNSLGRMYQKGYGVERDYAEALKWFLRAAEQGNTRAQNNLAWMYRNGWGVVQDDGKAVGWYRKSAEQGHVKAQNNLGEMYSEGRGVPQDDVQAYMWFELAASRGHDEAADHRKQLAERMSADQVDQARRLAREWDSR
jgi:TPR repeat protein